MPECVSCLCRVRRARNKCMHCFTDPPPPVWLDHWDGGDGMTCTRCDALLCPLHVTQHQLAHQRCNQCVHNSEDNTSSDALPEDSERDSEWESSTDDPRSDELSEEQEEAAQENTWFTQPHMNKRIRHTVYSKTGPPNGDDKCSICLEVMDATTDVAQLPCTGQHSFHTPCISQWLTTAAHTQTCPLCLDTLYVTIQCS